MGLFFKAFQGWGEFGFSATSQKHLDIAISLQLKSTPVLS
jgi:hypothetical protein